MLTFAENDGPVARNVMKTAIPKKTTTMKNANMRPEHSVKSIYNKTSRLSKLRRKFYSGKFRQLV